MPGFATMGRVSAYVSQFLEATQLPQLGPDVRSRPAREVARSSRVISSTRGAASRGRMPEGTWPSVAVTAWISLRLMAAPNSRATMLVAHDLMFAGRARPGPRGALAKMTLSPRLT